MNQPLIGLTLDSDEGSGLTKTARYALKANYAEAIAGAGGMPVGLPHASEAVEAYADRLDGLVVTGGAFDVGVEVALPFAEIIFAQPQIGPIAFRVEAQFAAHDLHRLAGAHQRTGHIVECGNVTDDISQDTAVPRRLAAPEIVQGRIEMALNTAFGIPARLAVADEVDQRHRCG